MKLEPLFEVKDNKLYKIADNSLVDLSTLKMIEIPWTTVEIEDESYNEEFLALLRDQLKGMENMNKFAVLVPLVDKPLETPEQFELFTNAFNHTARRVKDCISVVGYKLPSELTAAGFGEGTPVESFIETLAKKHEQYVYFSSHENTPANVIKM